MIDAVDGSPTTQIHALKFEAPAKLEAAHQVENQTKQAIKAQTSEATQVSPTEPDNKPDHRGQNVDISA